MNRRQPPKPSPTDIYFMEMQRNADFLRRQLLKNCEPTYRGVQTDVGQAIWHGYVGACQAVFNAYAAAILAQHHELYGREDSPEPLGA